MSTSWVSEAPELASICAKVMPECEQVIAQAAAQVGYQSDGDTNST